MTSKVQRRWSGRPECGDFGPAYFAIACVRLLSLAFFLLPRDAGAEMSGRKPADEAIGEARHPIP